MERLKNGANIKNYGEITELIINLINDSNEFSANLIINLTNNYIQGCTLKISEKDVTRMVHNVLDLMHKNGYLDCSKEVYKTKSSGYTLNEYYKHCQDGAILL